MASFWNDAACLPAEGQGVLTVSWVQGLPPVNSGQQMYSTSLIWIPE